MTFFKGCRTIFQIYEFNGCLEYKLSTFLTVDIKNIHLIFSGIKLSVGDEDAVRRGSPAVLCMSGSVDIAELVTAPPPAPGPAPAPATAAMHHCSPGGGPLAMVTPLHNTFDPGHAHLAAPHLGGSEEEEGGGGLVSSLEQPSHHLPAAAGHQLGADQLGDPADPSQHLPPHFSDPTDQAQFEADKRQIYK